MRAEHSVLVVESDASLRRSLEKFLNQAGYAFSGCSTAAQALALAQKAIPDVVIADYHLPDANGRSLIEMLNLLAPEAVIIVLSEYDYQTLVGDLYRCRIGTFLKKPFDLVDFEAALRSAWAEAGSNPTEDERLPEAKVQGVPASTLSQGTFRDR